MTPENWSVDLFCGAGGASEGLRLALAEIGTPLHQAAINHWDLAIESHAANHPGVMHYCDDLEKINPRDVVTGHLRLLVGAPPCTHFSNARGGKPRDEQQRATPRFILRWVRALLPDDILLENVPEFRTWGPLHRNHPDPAMNNKAIASRKGEYFRKFVRDIESYGYQVQWRVLCAADYGDPTSRQRLFIRARRGSKPIVWPKPTYAAKPRGGQRPWRTAREIINWDKQGRSIFSPVFGPQKNRYLVTNTMRRIFVGLQKHSGLAFVIGQQSGAIPRAVTQPLPTIATAGKISVVQPHLVMLYSSNAARSTDLPLPTVTAQGGHIGVAQPILVGVGGPAGQHAARSTNTPFPSQTSIANFAIAEPVLVEFHNGSRGHERTRALNQPLPTQDTSNRFGFAKPVLMTSEHRGYTFNVDAPFPTITSADAWNVAEPCIVPCNHGAGDMRAHSVGAPMPAITSVDAWGMAAPWFTVFNGTGLSAAVDNPLPTITSHERFGVNQPHVMQPADFFVPDRVDVPEAFGLFAQYVVKTTIGYGLLVSDGTGQFALLDILFRMLEWPELAAAHSFVNYQFRGTRDEVVKQIGNSVPVNTAKALCLAALKD